MFIDTRLGCLLVVALLQAAAASAQQSRPPSQPGNRRISLDVVVTPKSGAAIGDLQQQDFTVLDNNAPQTITSFKAVSGREASLEVIVVIDAVNATYQNVTYELAEIDRFLRAEGGHLAYPIALAVLTDSGIQMMGDFTTDGNALSASVDRNDIGLRTIRPSAGLPGAAERWMLSITALRQLVASEALRPGRKVILWVSPGWPLLSNINGQIDSKQEQQIFADIVSLSTRLEQARVTLYAISPLGAAESVLRAGDYKRYIKGVSKPSEALVGDLALPVLAIQSGGLAFSSNNDIANLLQQCLADTTPYYEISFEPPPADRRDEYHHLEVKLAEPGLTARTRQSYYAQPLRRE